MCEKRSACREGWEQTERAGREAEGRERGGVEGERESGTFAGRGWVTSAVRSVNHEACATQARSAAIVLRYVLLIGERSERHMTHRM